MVLFYVLVIYQKRIIASAIIKKTPMRDLATSLATLTDKKQAHASPSASSPRAKELAQSIENVHLNTYTHI